MFEVDRIINITHFDLRLYDRTSYITTVMSPIESAIYLYFIFGPKHSPIARSRPFTAISDPYSPFSYALESANMASTIMAKVKTDIFFLSEPASWDQRYEDTKASESSQMWKYFGPDSDAALTGSMEPLMPLDEPYPDGNEQPQVRNACITRNQRYKDVYFKRFQVFREHERKWDRYHEVDAQLR